MTSVPLSGQKTSSIPKGAKKGSIIYENTTDQSFYDLMIHVNDDSWDTPEFRKIYVHKLGRNNKTKNRKISVVGGDLTENEHPKWSKKNRIKPGQKMKVEFWLNDNLDEKAHITVTPTDKRGGVIIDGTDEHHEDITWWDKISELINIISKLAGFAKSFAPVSDTDSVLKTDAFAGFLGMRGSLQDIKLDARGKKELAKIDEDLLELSQRLISVVDRSVKKHIGDCESTDIG